MIRAGDPRSWYPVALSTEVGENPRPLRVGDQDYVLFRDPAGTPAAFGRYCPHMGSDLSRGSVVPGGLRCRLHGWVYDRDGACALLANGAGPHARLPRLATHEEGGVVYVWPGEAPDWPFPRPPGLEFPRAGRPRIAEFDCPMSAIGLNGFDIWHYSVVHRRDVVGEPTINSAAPAHIGLSFHANVRPGRPYDDLVIRLGHGVLRVQLDYWAGNLIFVRNLNSAYVALLALAARENERCRLYLSVFRERARTSRGQLAETVKLAFMRRIAWAFLQADIPVMAGMRPAEGILLPGHDDVAKHFWTWWGSLPRIAADTA